ncbi:hypothetical protein SISSUDRAFT_1062772 [Sistotremastrum suecicum HHB10207 ss-3]|uniref:F-box domain-containing protein n=1 Tax=Sistotremastrum suecicum HHB10207 ss-3 TaxID=1314776 RepID=A0A166CJB4_9AGAM|nr:hypothetical protein SISSUDRAFT_1062772 [Sistotremastrum suecicum HHB10207 ss-3]
MPRSTKRSKKSRVIPPSVPDDERKGGEEPDGPKLKFPPELWRNIVEEVALSIPDGKARAHALYNLLLISRDIHPEARRLLYRDITFAHNTPAAGQISDALHAGAAKYVRSIRVQNLVGEVRRRGRSAKNHFSHLPLDSMNGLRSLDLSGSWMRNPSEVAELLRSSIPPNSLITFHALLSFSDDILPFLRQQKNIRFLSLYRFDKEPTPSLRSRELMPNLKRFKMYYLNENTNNFQEFIEDRSITVFHSGSFFRFPDNWSTFAPRLQCLDISSSIVSVNHLEELLEVIATTAINLRLFACSQASTFPNIVPATIPAVFRALSNLRHLEVLAISVIAFSIGNLDIMIVPDVVGTSTQLKSILVTQFTLHESPGDVVAHELQYTTKSGWIVSRRDGIRRVDWFESWLRKVHLAYC